MSEAESSDIWAGDLLDRKSDADFLISFLIGRVNERAQQGLPKSYVLNLNSRWGRGKTYFLTRLQKQLSEGGYLAVYVNAWSDDHADTPLISVMAAIDDVLAPKILANPTLKKLWSGVKDNAMQIAATASRGVAVQVAKRFLGDVAHEIAEIVTDSSPIATGSAADGQDSKVGAIADAIDKASEKTISKALDDFRARSRTISSFRARTAGCLAKFGEEQKLPLFVLVDELDRCRPSYAIEMLEQIKHLFEIDGVVFLVATDTDQLSHAVSAVYGPGFDSSRYLLRFFDRTYVFREPDLTPLVRYLFKQYGIDEGKLCSPPENDHVEFFTGAMKYFRIQPRDAHQCFDLLRSVVTLWPHKSNINLALLLPLIVAHQSGNAKEFERLSSLRLMTETQIKESRIPEWYLRFPGVNPGEVDQVHFTDLHEHLTRYASLTLGMIGKEDKPKHPNLRWALSTFLAEIAANYAGSGYPTKLRSTALSYPELVSSAAQFKIG